MLFDLTVTDLGKTGVEIHSALTMVELKAVSVPLGSPLSIASDLPAAWNGDLEPGSYVTVLADTPDGPVFVSDTPMDTVAREIAYLRGE